MRLTSPKKQRKACLSHSLLIRETCVPKASLCLDTVAYSISAKTRSLVNHSYTKHYMVIDGMDFGWDHPQSRVQLAIDMGGNLLRH